MKTNLIFKRQLTIDGITRVVTRIVPVDIPQIDPGEGWTLSGHTDVVETVDPSIVYKVLPAPAVERLDEDSLTKFESPVAGTAKLVRSKGVIKIVARKGKTTANVTTPNSVCISDVAKTNFFKNCREIHGSDVVYEFSMKTTPAAYDYWNGVIDIEYQRQKKLYITNFLKQSKQ